MDIFEGWENHTLRIEKNWREKISPEDTVVIPGDVSWAMKLRETKEDMAFIDSLPGTKVILKGNHDYWWDTMAKMTAFLKENGFDSINIVHNSHYPYGSFGICGTRGWIAENGEPADAKILAREAARLETSIASAEKAKLSPLVFLHYPPVYNGCVNHSIMEVLKKHGIKECRYGHIHGRACRNALNGSYDGIDFRLVSGDYIQFDPVKIL